MFLRFVTMHERLSVWLSGRTSPIKSDVTPPFRTSLVMGEDVALAIGTPSVRLTRGELNLHLKARFGEAAQLELEVR